MLDERERENIQPIIMIAIIAMCRSKEYEEVERKNEKEKEGERKKNCSEMR